VFAPSLFIGATSGMAFGEIAAHVLGSGAGSPALYAAVAMGAVFASAARAPLTSVASVVEMTGDYTLTLPVMLAVAIATATSRALSYGTIYTTKLLRRGQDVDRAAPWRAFGDLKAADAMRPFAAPLPVPGESRVAGSGIAASGTGQVPVTLGEATWHGDPLVVYAGESLAQTLRQLAAYGRDGLPVLSADGRQVRGWITNASVLQAVASQLGASPPPAADAPAGLRSRAPDDGELPDDGEPPDPLPGYQVLEFPIRSESATAGRTLGSICLPDGSIPVSVLRDRALREPDPDLVLAPGDRVSVLAPVPADRAVRSEPTQMAAEAGVAAGYTAASMRAEAAGGHGPRGGQRDDEP
jgi:chloride channel protein, CIC family